MTGKQVKTKPESVCEKTPVFESGFVRYISKMCGSLIHALTNHNTFTIIFSKVTKSNQRKQMPIPHIRINKDLTCMSTIIITSTQTVNHTSTNWQQHHRMWLWNAFIEQTMLTLQRSRPLSCGFTYPCYCHLWSRSVRVVVSVSQKHDHIWWWELCYSLLIGSSRPHHVARQSRLV